MILETIEILDSNLELTLTTLKEKINNGDYDDLLVKYTLLILISDGLVVINKDKTTNLIAPSDLDQYIKHDDYATQNKGGTVKVHPGYGTKIGELGTLMINKADQTMIDEKINETNPIVPSNLNAAVKSAISGNNRINDMTDEEKANARGVIGAINKDDLTEYVKNTDYATSTTTGVVKVNSSYGIGYASDNSLRLFSASPTEISNKSANNRVITPANLDYAVRSVYPITQTSITDPITVNTIYDLGLQTSLDVILPSGQVGDFIQIDFISGSTPTNLTVSSSNGIIGFDLIPEVNRLYSIYLDWGIIGCNTDGTNNIFGWRFSYLKQQITLTETTSEN